MHNTEWILRFFSGFVFFKTPAHLDEFEIGDWYRQQIPNFTISTRYFDCAWSGKGPSVGIYIHVCSETSARFFCRKESSLLARPEPERGLGRPALRGGVSQPSRQRAISQECGSSPTASASGSQALPSHARTRPLVRPTLCLLVTRDMRNTRLVDLNVFNTFSVFIQLRTRYTSARPAVSHSFHRSLPWGYKCGVMVSPRKRNPPKTSSIWSVNKS